MSEANNAKLEKVVPEIAASTYGKYPMNETEWLDLSATGPKGEPAHLAGPDVGPKRDYVFGRGPYGEAYYHLLTKQSYLILYSRVSNAQPVGCCSCFSSAAVRKDLSDYDDVRLILHARSVASIPSDKQAAEDALTDAKSTANAFHNALQNEQLAINFIQVVN